ncbi:MAG: aminotransferase class V-fold PLP-dependent enzyme, partial [Gammaproteobacteria bacterium]
NTSEGLSVVAHGLDWKPGQNVVTSRQEFPSNRIVWQSLESRFGVEARLADLSAADDPEAELFALVDDNTRVIAISAVQYATGLRMDLARIGAFCRERKILFCVDAIQQLGALPFDVQTVQADFVVADGHKWMLGPEGIALFYARPELRDTLGLHQYGWHMVEHAHDFDREDWEPAYSARRFECGSPNMLGIHGLQASLSLIRETGLEIISENISKNIQYLIEKLEEKNMEILSDLRPERRSGILTFRPPGDVAAVYEHLQGQGVLCALRGGGIRFSPHYYTSREDMDRALTLLTGA